MQNPLRNPINTFIYLEKVHKRNYNRSPDEFVSKIYFNTRSSMKSAAFAGVLRHSTQSKKFHYYIFYGFAERRVKVDTVVSVKCANIYISSRFIFSKI